MRIKIFVSTRPSPSQKKKKKKKNVTLQSFIAKKKKAKKFIRKEGKLQTTPTNTTFLPLLSHYSFLSRTRRPLNP